MAHLIVFFLLLRVTCCVRFLLLIPFTALPVLGDATTNSADNNNNNSNNNNNTTYDNYDDKGKSLLRRAKNLNYIQKIDEELLFKDISKQKESRVVGGTDAGFTSYPYFVHWQGAGCGATLIGEDMLLSAAHCYYNFGDDNDDFHRVLIGSSYWGAGYVREIVEFYIHPNYDHEEGENDYLVMKINVPVTNVQPVQLNADRNYPPVGSELTVIGYGDIFYGNNGIMRLQEVNVKNIEHDECVDKLATYTIEYHTGTERNTSYSCTDYNNCDMKDANVILCAEASDREIYQAGDDKKGACQGDSGGPLLDTNGVQVGIVSWGLSCGDGVPPGIYSRVSGAIDWIRQQVCRNSIHPPSSYCASVNIAITSDYHPDDNYFTIYEHIENTMHGTVALYSSELSVAPLNTFFLSLSLLAPGSYSLAITDSFGDGMCCDFGQGRVVISTREDGSDEEILESRWATFDTLLRVNFNLPRPAAARVQKSIQHASDENRQHLLQIEIQYDSHPWETAWGLYYVNDYEQHTLIYWSEYGTAQTPNRIKTIQIDSLRDGQYLFSIFDSSNDGIINQGDENDLFIWRIKEIGKHNLDHGRTIIDTIHESKNDFTSNGRYTFVLSSQLA